MKGSSINKLKLIQNHLKKKVLPTSYEYLDFDSFLTEDEIKTRIRLRDYLEQNITHKLNDFFEKQELPLNEIKQLNKEFGIVGASKKGYGSPERSTVFGHVIWLELSRSDLSVESFLVVQSEVVSQTIYMLGTEEQKKKYLPKCYSLDLIGCFCLTEPEVGSDAGNILTTAKKVDGGWIINGNKRWIGAGTNADFFIIWAKNIDTKDVIGFVVDRRDMDGNLAKGITTKKIEGKYSARMVQNADIEFVNLFARDEDKLVSTNFNDGPNKVLVHSRIAVTWGALGIAVGAYDRTLQYAVKRKQFGKPIASFQLIQEKLCFMMSHVQAMLMLCKRCSDLYSEAKMSKGRAGMLKAWVTSKVRDCVRVAREIFGGNGVLLENWVIKALADAEATYTYEGSYDINLLACGRELTGISAFK